MLLKKCLGCAWVEKSEQSRSVIARASPSIDGPNLDGVAIGDFDDPGSKRRWESPGDPRNLDGDGDCVASESTSA